VPTVAGLAQQSARPAFDVVSIKPNRSGAAGGGLRFTPGGRVEWTNTTLRGLIRMAYQRYGFDPRDIVGGSPWIDSDRFDIIATSEKAPPTRPDGFPEELLAMVRALVEDRFKLQVHNEQRDGPVFELRLARGDGKPGAGLHIVPDACGEAMKALAERGTRTGPPPCSFGGSPGKLIGTGVTMTMTANVLSGYVGRLVVDRTGLAGSFDFEITFDPSSAAKTPGVQPGTAPRDDTAPSIVTALQEQLGLKLQSGRGPVDVLVVDRAERPTPN
jgi:uncharacterized protein (TIGR03435 family)